MSFQDMQAMNMSFSGQVDKESVVMHRTKYHLSGLKRHQKPDVLTMVE